MGAQKKSVPSRVWINKNERTYICLYLALVKQQLPNIYFKNKFVTIKVLGFCNPVKICSIQGAPQNWLLGTEFCGTAIFWGFSMKLPNFHHIGSFLVMCIYLKFSLSVCTVDDWMQYFRTDWIFQTFFKHHFVHKAGTCMHCIIFYCSGYSAVP